MSKTWLSWIAWALVMSVLVVHWLGGRDDERSSLSDRSSVEDLDDRVLRLESQALVSETWRGGRERDLVESSASPSPRLDSPEAMKRAAFEADVERRLSDLEHRLAAADELATDTLPLGGTDPTVVRSLTRAQLDAGIRPRRPGRSRAPPRSWDRPQRSSGPASRSKRCSTSLQTHSRSMTVRSFRSEPVLTVEATSRACWDD